MWHASGFAFNKDPRVSRAMGLAALQGVGARLRGEWTETTPRGVFNIRRRLTSAEQAVVGPAIDIRGTAEEATRLARLFEAVPHLRELFAGL